MSTARLLARIRREFKNHPGIVVTLPQAQSLWSLGKSHCTQVFEPLMAEGLLNRVGDVYLWPEAPTPRFKIVERTRAYHSSRASRVSPLTIASGKVLAAQASELPVSAGRFLTDSVARIQYWSGTKYTPKYPTHPLFWAAVSGRVELCP